MDRHAHWQDVYRTKPETEVSWFQERPESSLELIQRTGVGHTAAIIDIGGGASRLVDHLLDQGFTRLTVLDIAEAALTRAQERLGERAGRVSWVAADVTQWKPGATFDLWHDRAVFHFLTDAADRRTYADTMAAALPAGGQAIVGTFAADGPEKCSGLPVCRYAAEALAAEFAPQFHLLGTLTEDHLTPAGKVQKFQFCRMIRT